MIGLEVVVTACLLTNAAGLAASAFVLNRHHINPTGPRLISFAVGVLLGVVLLDLLPHLWEATGNLAALLGLFAAALLASWLMDRACACNHLPVVCHASEASQHPGGHRASPSRGAGLVLVGDFVHRLVDGALIVAGTGGRRRARRRGDDGRDDPRGTPAHCHRDAAGARRLSAHVGPWSDGVRRHGNRVGGA